MSVETPYIGSKISLISKAKVRYEGFLYTIDPEKLTVTLAKVKTFGTEDRAKEVVPPKNEIYEYVVFRGKDIDDLTVCETPQPYQQDPAIVQTGSAHCAPLGAGLAAPSAFSSQQQQQLPPNTYNSTPQYYGYGMYDNNAQANPNLYPMNYHSQAPTSHMPKPDNSVPASSGNSSILNDASRGRTNVVGEDKPQASFAAPGGPVKTNNKPTNAKPSMQGRTSNRGKSKEEDKPGRGNDASSDRSDSTRRNDGSKDQKQEDAGTNQTKNNKDVSEKRSRSRRQHDPNHQSGQKSLYTKNKSTFSEEFDFESSNAKFNKEEVSEDFLKTLRKTLKINESSESGTSDDPQTNSSMTNSSAAIENDEMPSPDRCYNKSRSFFDSISCESDVKDNKFRSHERKLNVETFGVTSQSYRGRSYSRGRGRGGRGGRGGWSNNRNNAGRGGWSNREGGTRVTANSGE